MSSFRECEFECQCGSSFTARVWESVNVTQDPELKRAVLDGELNAVTCPQCHVRERVEATFLYHDMERRLMVFVYPADKEEDWEEGDDKAMRQVASVLGQLSGGEGGGTEVRVVFGLDALAQLVSGLERDADPAAPPSPRGAGPLAIPSTQAEDAGPPGTRVPRASPRTTERKAPRREAKEAGRTGRVKAGTEAAARNRARGSPAARPSARPAKKAPRSARPRARRG